VIQLVPRLRRFAHLLVGIVFMLRGGPPHQAVTAGRYVGVIPLHTALVACSCGSVFYSDDSDLALAGLQAFDVPARPSARRRRRTWLERRKARNKRIVMQCRRINGEIPYGWPGPSPGWRDWLRDLHDRKQGRDR
jgi:hypothetical protein